MPVAVANSAQVASVATASEPALLEPLRAGRLKVVGATYGLSNGVVDFYDGDGRPA